MAGDTIIKPNELDIKFKVNDEISKKYHLEVDKHLSEYDAMRRTLDMYNLTAPVSNIVFASFLIGFKKVLMMILVNLLGNIAKGFSNMKIL